MSQPPSGPTNPGVDPSAYPAANGYPSAPAYPSPSAPGHPTAAVPDQSAFMAAAPAPAPKKKRTGLIVLIVVLAVAIVGTGVFLGVKSVIGNRLTSYCQTFKSMETQMTDAATQMSTAASAGDISGVSDALDSMISSFTNLQTTNPPDTVSPALETFIRDFGAIKQATDTDGLEGFVTSYTTYASEIDQASTTIDDASVAYCT